MDPCYPERKTLHHETPDWVVTPEFFITVCCRLRGKNFLCHARIGLLILESAKYLQHRGLWDCELLLLMPDHLHLLASFSERKDIRQVMALWKRWLAVQGRISFQRGFFEHRLRSQASACAKWTYIHLNPVRKALIHDPFAWPYRWTRKNFNAVRPVGPDLRIGPQF